MNNCTQKIRSKPSLSSSYLKPLPLPLRNITPLQTRLHTQRDILGHATAKQLNIAALEGKVVGEGRGEDIVVEVEQALGALLDARVLGGEARHEGRVRAVWIELGVDGALGEDGHLVLGELVADYAQPVL